MYLAAVLRPAVVPRRWQAALELNHRGAFDVNSWQLVYVLGILFGGHYATIVSRARQHYRRSFWIALAAFALLAGFRFNVERGGSWAGRLPDWLRFERHPLSPARGAYIALQILLIGLVTIRHWDGLRDSAAVRIVVSFGRNSLGVFIGSIFLDYLLKAAMDAGGWGPSLNLALWFAELGVLYALARWSGRPASPPPPAASGPDPRRARIAQTTEDPALQGPLQASEPGLLRARRRHEDRGHPGEPARQDVGEDLVADQGDPPPVEPQHPQRDEASERQRLECPGHAGDAQRVGERPDPPILPIGDQAKQDPPAHSDAAQATTSARSSAAPWSLSVQSRSSSSPSRPRARRRSTCSSRTLASCRCGVTRWNSGQRPGGGPTP